MIDIGSHTGHKLGILLILTTLTIGSAAGLSWESPNSNNNVFGEGFELNVSSADNVASVSFWYKQSSESNYTSFDEGIGANGDGYYVSGVFDQSSGEYDFKVNSSDNNEEQTLNGVILDKNRPNSPESESPTDYISDEDPEVSMEVSDDLSGVDYSYLNVTDSDNDDVDSTEGTNLELSNLDDEEYTVDYTIVDNAGNERTNSWTFTVDTSYDGDDNPSFSVEDESGGVVLFDEDKDLTVDFGDADSTSDTTVTCYVAGEDIGDFTVDANDDNPDEDDTTCRIDDDDGEDYYDSEAEIYLGMEDEAGNTAESDSETVAFDVNPPTVTDLEIPTNAELYNADFDVEFSAYDSASDVEEVEYYFDSDTDYGEGTEFDYSSDTESYEIDTSGLEAGDHTLYVRARDEAERWSSSKTVDFSFDSDAVPEISLDVPENVSVTAGQQGSFDVTVENTGELHISSVELTGSAEGVFSDSQSISDLEPGESVTATLDVDTNPDNIGEHTIEVSTDNPSMTEEIGLVVEANSDQQNQIDSNLSTYQNMLQEMETNVTSLRQKVSEDKKQRLNSDFSKFKQKVEDAQSAVDEGDYYEAEAILEGIDQDRSAAESTYKAVQSEYQNNQFWMMIFLGLGGLVVLGGGAIGALSYTDEFDFDIRDYLEDLQETEIDVDTSSLERIPEKIKGMIEGKDTSEAEDFEWEGFNNK